MKSTLHSVIVYVVKHHCPNIWFIFTYYYDEICIAFLSKWVENGWAASRRFYSTCTTLLIYLYIKIAMKVCVNIILNFRQRKKGCVLIYIHGESIVAAALFALNLPLSQQLAASPKESKYKQRQLFQRRVAPRKFCRIV